MQLKAALIARFTLAGGSYFPAIHANSDLSFCFGSCLSFGFGRNSFVGKLTVIPVRASSLLEELSAGRLCVFLRGGGWSFVLVRTLLSFFYSARFGKNDKFYLFWQNPLLSG